MGVKECEKTDVPFSGDAQVERSLWFYPGKNLLVLYGMGVIEDGENWCFSSELALLETGFVRIGDY